MSTLPTQLARLLHSETYPHATHNIRVVETHISWVVLTGLFAYKIKKPIDLGFVNYLTLSRRHHYCHEEVRLNRRLAPELYLDVVRVVSHSGELAFESDSDESTAAPQNEKTVGGSVIEYAVKMKQFDQSQLLSSQIQHRSLPTEWFEQLGQRLARFHDRCEIASASSDFGDGDVFAGEVRETLGVLDSAKQLPAGVRERLVEVRRWFRKEFLRLSDFLRARQSAGYIRACHGDLHCGNMLVVGDRITVFDGIEFNEHFRWIDTLNDLAFAWMDLIDRGATNEASRLLNRYLEASGDYEGLAAWRLFVANRALVRAKVSALRCAQMALNDASESSVAIEEVVSEMVRYVELAHKIATDRRVWAVLTSGISGSGKSFLARRICDLSGAVCIRSDVERKRIGLERANSSRFLDEDDRHRQLSDEWYAKEVSLEVHDQLATCLRSVIQAGIPAVVDATFLSRELREPVTKVATQLGVPYSIVQVDVDADTAIARLDERRAEGDQTSDATRRVVECQLLNEIDWSDEERQHLLQLTNDRNTDIDHLAQVVVEQQALR